MVLLPIAIGESFSLALEADVTGVLDELNSIAACDSPYLE